VTSIATIGAGNPRTHTSSTGLAFFLRDVSRSLERRMLEITATALSDGRTGIMVQTQSQWVRPRPAASVIPATVRALRVTEVTAAGRVRHTDTVTVARRVRRTIADVNGLEVVQPGTTSCPEQPAGENRLVVSFLARPGSSPVATATFDSDFGHRGSGVASQCDPVRLQVGEPTRVRLLAAHYTAALRRLLGIRFP
jgi:hypothetical protein